MHPLFSSRFRNGAGRRDREEPVEVAAVQDLKWGLLTGPAVNRLEHEDFNHKLRVEAGASPGNFRLGWGEQRQHQRENVPVHNVVEIDERIAHRVNPGQRVYRIE